MFRLRDLELDSLGNRALELDHIPDGAVAIDLRSKAEFQGWHWPGALQLDFGHALESYPSFDRGQRYVLYCEIGLKSAHLAELMRKEGLRAFHVSGGVKALEKLAAQRSAR